ncbi:hypothetical protein QJQ45_006436 [Haematococcus lacustris]|nr:hypothetical protein QJQ45_006436 [Haematococcus lacustris]
MQLAQANRGHRASSSPARRRPVGSATRPSPPHAWPSKAGPNPYAPPVAKPASSGGRLPYPGVTGGPMQAGLSPGKLVGTGALPSASWQGQSGQASSGRSGSGPGAGDEFEQLLRAAHASVQPAALQPVPHHTQWQQQQQLGQGQEQQQVRQGREQQVEQAGAAGQPGSSVSGQVSPTPCPTLPRPTPPVAWGRSALLMGATPLLAPLPSGSTPATATQAQLPASVSSPPRDSHHLAALPPDSPGAATAQPRPVAAAWGRSALLNSAASAGDGSLPGPPLAPAPLSAPLSGAGQWGRSMLLGTQPGGPGQGGQEEAEDRRASQGQVPMQARQVAHYSEGSPARLQPMAAPGGCKAVPGGRGGPPRGYQPASPGQLGKGSLLYILGSSASSFRAKALAAAVAHQGWG